MKIKTALVTGASRGLGKAFCKQLGEKGVTVILSARNKEAGIQATTELKALGYDIHFRELDVNNEAQLQALSLSLQEDFPCLDLLINNAGVNSKSGGSQTEFLKNFRLDMLEAQSVLDMIRTNSLAPIMTVKYLLPLLKKSRNPKVINISSWLGAISQKTNGGNYSYCASKAALNMLTRAMAFDVIRDGITVIAANPGWVKTDMGGERAKLSPEEAVKGLLRVAENLTSADAGKFFQWDGSEHPW